MGNEEYIFKEVEKLYLEFSETVKPLVATVEAEREEFPIGILNEVRAFNDHIARCFAEKNDEIYTKQQLDKARNHITRICLDCYKILILTYKDHVDQFNKINKKVDLSMVNNGIFFQNLTALSKEAISKTKKAKLEETKKNPTNLRCKYYQEAFIAYYDMRELIDNNAMEVHRVKCKTYFKAHLGLAGWFVALMLSGLLANNNQTITNWISGLFNMV